MSKKKKNESKSGSFQKLKVKYKVEYEATISNVQQRYPKWRIFALVAIAVIAIVIGLAIGLQPSNEATTARDGDTVKVAYIGTYDNESVFDSGGINGSDPLEFTIGNSSLIPGFEKGVIGMSVNETKTIHVAPEDGYGQKYFEVNLDDLPEDPQIGETLYKTDAYGRDIQATVINISESGATLENTAPLAGENLNFEITLVELIKAE